MGASRKNKQILHRGAAKKFIGRKGELQYLDQLSNSNESLILIVHGRRRVGKTALLHKAFEKRKLFKFEGIEGRPPNYQRKAMLHDIAQYLKNPRVAKRKYQMWRPILELIATKLAKGKCTLYFEEFQWLCSYRTELVAELKHVWDNMLSKNPEIIVILCGSSPSFMLNKVLKSKALYNRSLHLLQLKEFGLPEAQEYLKHKSQEEVLEGMLAVGGIPEYLKYLASESSVRLGLIKHAFTSTGFFVHEYDKIFISSLADNKHYRKIVEFLAKRRFAARDEIAHALNMRSGGGLTSLLEDLELCGFIEHYTPFNLAANSKISRYAISDQYLGLYFKFIKPLQGRILKGEFDQTPVTALSLTAYQKWLGFAFEAWCRKNHTLFAKILGFSGVQYKVGTFFQRVTDYKNQEVAPPSSRLQDSSFQDGGFQIDLVFDRADRVMTLCEVKNTAATVGKEVIQEFETKLQKFPWKDKRSIHKVLITVSPPDKRLATAYYFDRIIELNDIFRVLGSS